MAEQNFSDRWVGIVAETKPPGNDPHKVAEAIRKNGVIDEALLPFDEKNLNSVEDYFSFKGADEKVCRDKGHVWLNRFDFKHEWLWTDDLKDISKRHKLLKEYLKYSPLGISVTAWKQNENGEYTSDGQDNTHWCMAFKIDDQNRVYVFDSYDQEIKILTADHDIQFAKRYNIREKSPEEQLSGIKVSLISLILNYVKSIINKTSKGFGEFIEATFSKRQD